jgi:hypothetical protein
MSKPYYLAYEERYQKVFSAGGTCWGHAPDDETLVAVLKKWVNDNNLVGKKIIEFACGEGASGVILSKLGCHYHGVDIAPSAVYKSTNALKGFSNARVSLLDMVKETTGEIYDAALDCMGLHMLVTDCDRNDYLCNAFKSLKSGAPMLFFRESYRDANRNNRETAYDGNVQTYEQWKEITGDDYDTPFQRYVKSDNGEIEVWVPLVPARANSKKGYFNEMQSIGFVVENFVEMDLNNENPYSASIYVRKP